MVTTFECIPLKNRTESEEESGRRLAAACCVTYIIQKYKLPVQPDQKSAIFMALLLFPDIEKRKCEDFRQLLEVYFVEKSWIRLNIYIVIVICRCMP